MTQADVDAGVVANVATANGTTPGGDQVESPEVEHTVPVDDAAGLTVEKSAELADRDGDGLADAGETIT